MTKTEAAKLQKRARRAKQENAQARLNKAAIVWADDAPDIDDKPCKTPGCVRCNLLLAVRAFQKAVKP